MSTLPDRAAELGGPALRGRPARPDRPARISRHRTGRSIAIATGLLVVSLVAGISLGPVAVPLHAIAGTLLAHLPWHPAVSVPQVDSAIIWQIRLPRVVLGAIVGSMLAGGGAAYQGVFRNSLADPYLLGVAAGAGASLAFATDLRIAADTAGINLAFAGIALSCDTGISWTLPRLIGTARATDLLYFPRTVKAAEALELGLASRVVPADELATATAELASTLAAGPTVAYGAIRRSINSSTPRETDGVPHRKGRPHGFRTHR